MGRDMAADRAPSADASSVGISGSPPMIEVLLVVKRLHSAALLITTSSRIWAASVVPATARLRPCRRPSRRRYPPPPPWRHIRATRQSTARGRSGLVAAAAMSAELWQSCPSARNRQVSHVPRQMPRDRCRVRCLDWQLCHERYAHRYMHHHSCLDFGGRNSNQDAFTLPWNLVDPRGEARGSRAS